MKKITLNLKSMLFLALGLLMFTTNAQVDVVPGAFSALNESSTGQEGIFKTPTFSTAQTNFSNTSTLTWNNIFALATTSVPRLANGVEFPIDEGYKFEVDAAYNPILVSEVRFIFNNGTSNKGGTDPLGAGNSSQWKVQGSNDDAAWTDLSATIVMNSANAAVETAVTLTSTIAYRYYRFVSAIKWTPNQAFTALTQLDFTVANVLSVENDVLNDAFEVYPNPANSIINISNSKNIDVKNVKLINVIGKEVYSNNDSAPIDVKGYSSGIYFLKIETAEGAVSSRKVIIE